ncbi:thrombopoietin, isoform CRA_b [Rattus norvegicus]|uniref:Thrombopoietin, isoform CRA_b n=1 Tax=Rattus norvegicus TaxID=10116 RepID=A6JS81_RAT|nr:thrombopoietin, isoform CRA_b [Rattus norvegicus]
MELMGSLLGPHYRPWKPQTLCQELSTKAPCHSTSRVDFLLSQALLLMDTHFSLLHLPSPPLGLHPSSPPFPDPSTTIPNSTNPHPGLGLSKRPVHWHGERSSATSLRGKLPQEGSEAAH